MIDVKVKLDSRLFKTNQVVNIISDEFTKAMQKSVVLGETTVAEIAPVGVTAQLRQGITGKVLSPVHGKIFISGPAAKYGQIVEEGRRPGKFPPPDLIKQWLKRTNKGKLFVLKIQRELERKRRKTITKISRSAVRKAIFKGEKSRRAARQKSVSAFKKILNEQALRQATYLKSKGIAEKGTRPVRMFKKGERKIRPRVIQFFEQAVRNIERRLSD